MTNMQQNGVLDLLKLLEYAIENGFTLIPGKFVVVKPDEIYQLIDRIAVTIPSEIKDARDFLSRIEEVKMAAQQEAQKIISDAQMEAEERLSEANFVKEVEREGIKIMNQVKADCEELKKKALEEAEEIRSRANAEAMKTKEGAELYAEETLAKLEEKLNIMQQEVKNGQIYLEQLRTSSGTGSNYYNTNKIKTPDYVME
jgi:cell division septum initiation protein DivIVA